MAEKKEHNRADQGLNTKVYMIAIVVALLVLLAAIYFFVAAQKQKIVPNANQPHPNSRLILPEKNRQVLG